MTHSTTGTTAAHAPKRTLGTIVLVWMTFGCLIGVALGFFSYIRQTPRFESSAQIQIRDSVSHGAGGEATIDDCAVIVGKPVVTAAVRTHQLERLAELRSPSGSMSTEQAVDALLSGGRLSARRITANSTGVSYEIRYRGFTPSSSRQVVQAVVGSMKESLPEAGERDAWNQSLRLLTEAREQVAEKIAALNDRLDRIEEPGDALLEEGNLVSAASLRWDALRRELDGQHVAIAGLRERILNLESLVAEGASTATILQQLDRPVSRRFEVASAASGSDQAVDPQQRQQQLAELQRKVDQELAPLEAEVSRLLQRFGASHPTVVAVKRKIESVKSKFGVVEDEVVPIASESRQALRSGTDEEKLRAVERLLQVLREQVVEREDVVQGLLERLDQTAVEMAKQDRVLRRQRALREQLQQQQRFAAEILARLKPLEEIPPFVSTSLHVLRAPDPGVQVAPLLTPHLVVGGTLGTLAGGAVGVLMLLAAALGNQKPIEEDADSATADPLDR